MQRSIVNGKCKLQTPKGLQVTLMFCIHADGLLFLYMGSVELTHSEPHLCAGLAIFPFCVGCTKCVTFEEYDLAKMAHHGNTVY